MQCNYEFSRGNGSGVAEAIGNWGFSNQVCTDGQEIERLKCLFEKMNSLRKSKPTMCIRYDRKNDPDAWDIKPSPHECKPTWTFPVKRPLITYSSTEDTIIVSNLNSVGTDFTHIIPERKYLLQGTSKWYRRGPECCPQPSCLAPQYSPNCH